MIEIEKRGRLDPQNKLKLRNFLQKNATLVNDCNQLNIFIEFNNPFLGDIENTKASINVSISKDKINHTIKCKLKSKTGRMESGKRIESSMDFTKSDLDEVFKFLSIFQITEGCPRFYHREDYSYNGLNITLKEGGLAPDHFEIDIELEDKDQEDDAEKLIEDFLSQHNLQAYTESEYKEIMLNVFKENPPIPMSEIDLGLIG